VANITGKFHRQYATIQSQPMCYRWDKRYIRSDL